MLKKYEDIPNRHKMITNHTVFQYMIKMYILKKILMRLSHKGTLWRVLPGLLSVEYVGINIKTSVV
jgi:predicted transcriptional regulator of viral defense system